MPSRLDNTFRVLSPEDIGITKRDLKGDEYLEILRSVKKIIFHQKRHSIKEGIKGFIFYGDVGLGKTTIAKAIAYELGSRLIFVDGSDIARPKYGEAENQISRVFQEATKYRHTIILIDDCESVFPARDWAGGESWHVAQNNVFFHELDNIDTSKISVVLTTNRYDLLDKAVKDRLQEIEFPKPGEEALTAIAKQKMDKLKMDGADKVFREIEDGRFETIREMENYVMEKYIQELAKL